MISITPQGTVSLCQTPLENDYTHQLTFISSGAQHNYFASTVVKTATDYTYMKKDNAIKVDYNIDEIINCNYLFYKNTGFSNKWYYCFITNMEYVNENCTRIYIETDVFQTYQFNLVKKACFIEREHVADDTMGLHTLDEGLDTGEYVINSAGRVTDKMGAAKYIVVVNKYLSESDMGSFPARTIYGNLFSGYAYLYFDNDGEVRKLIQGYNGWGQIDSIINIFTIPAGMITLSTTSHTINSWGSGNIHVSYAEIPMSIRPYNIETNVTYLVNHDLNGYTPKNNKMLCFPYQYLTITNNAGNEVIYKYEEALNNTPSFNIEGVICPGCSIKLYPTNYKRYNAIQYPNDPHLYPKEFNYGLTAGKFPNCSWSTDAYTNWLTQNAVNEKYEDIHFGYSMFANRDVNEESPTAIGNLMGEDWVGKGIGHFLNKIQRREQAQFIPNQTKGNVNAGDIAYSANVLTFYGIRMTVNYEHAKMCDDYLSMFGYKVNEVKIPNWNTRTNWNYIKTVGANFEGDIPQVYMNKIKQIFDRGITLWHDPATMLDYTQSNTIVS